MSMIVQADSTYAHIEEKVRRLTASASNMSLSSVDIQQAVNTFYSQDFPYGIKIDQMRSVYTFFTEPYRDRYPLDVNFNQGVRAPVYVEGIQGSFFKDRQQFYSVWPRFPTKFQVSGNSAGSILNIIQPTNPCQIVTNTSGLATGDTITIMDVGGMNELNGNSYVITVVNANLLTLNGVDNTAYGAYTGGGSWTSLTVRFNIQGPFLSKEVVIGGVDINGSPISVNDDGHGNLQLLTPNAVVSIPLQTTNPAVPGMYNLNTGNPGLLNPVNIGTVNYVTGDFVITYPIAPAPGTMMTVWVSQYQTGRPYCLLFWNNEFTIRPVPKLIHKVEVETFLTPVQFMNQNDVPILNQWWQYIAYGSAMEILRERQDLEGVENLREGFKRQEALVLERQGIEELFTPNVTILNSMNTAVGGVNGIGYW